MTANWRGCEGDPGRSYCLVGWRARNQPPVTREDQRHSVIDNLVDKGIGAIGDRDALLRRRRDIDRVDAYAATGCQSPLARLQAASRGRTMGSEATMHNLPRRSILIGLPTLVACAAAAEEKRLALKGYDPVSYFTEGRPEQGTAEYQAAFDDATYWFKNAEHRAMFVADPDHYAPQFRGFCTVTLTHGQKYEADPEAWAIADGKLYVFGAKEALPIFQTQTASIIEKASDNWAKLRNTP